MLRDSSWFDSFDVTQDKYAHQRLFVEKKVGRKGILCGCVFF